MFWINGKFLVQDKNRARQKKKILPSPVRLMAPKKYTSKSIVIYFVHRPLASIIAWHLAAILAINSSILPVRHRPAGGRAGRGMSRSVVAAAIDVVYKRRVKLCVYIKVLHTSWLAPIGE